MGFLDSVQRVQIKSPLAWFAAVNELKRRRCAAVAQCWTAAASSRLRVLVDIAFRKLRQSFVGLLFLGKRLFQ